MSAKQTSGGRQRRTPREPVDKAEPTTPVEEPQPEVFQRLADLEARVVRQLRDQGWGSRPDEISPDVIAAVGDPVVNEGRLYGWTAARYGQGRWVSNAVVRRVREAVKS